MQHTGSTLVSNNEIIGLAPTSWQTAGINYYNANVNAIHNSVYLSGSGNQYGISTAESIAGLSIQNNNLIVESDKGFPVSLFEASPTAGTIQNNNYYAPVYVGRFNQSGLPPLINIDARTIAQWQTVVTGDQSVNVFPHLIDITQSLELANYAGLYCPAHASVPTDIKGTSRSNPTTVGAYGLFIPPTPSISLLQITAPVNKPSALCADDFVSIRYQIINTGNAIYDFTADTLYVHVHLRGMKDDWDTTVFVATGSLTYMQTAIVAVADFVDVSFAGDYSLMAWLSSQNNTHHQQDTLHTVYRTNKIALPFDEDFTTGESPDIVVENSVGTNGWHVQQGGDALINPNFGTGMLVFDASYGSISNLKIGQLELERTAQPKLDFWVTHDNTEPTKRDQIVVKVSWNNGLSEDILYQVKRYDANYTTPGWKQYRVDLAPYVDSACVMLILESYSYGGIQHIDRIAITSNQDIALKSAMIPQLSVCNRTDKELKLILSNETAQPIDFALTPAELYVSLTGAGLQRDTVYRLTATMAGMQVDTLTIFSHVDFTVGSYAFTAYIQTALADSNKLNDTIKMPIRIQPALSVQIRPESGGTTRCILGDVKLQQTVVITNTGNMPLSDIGLKLYLHVANNDIDSLFDSHPITNFLPGDSITHLFSTGYTVPWLSFYGLIAKAYLLCDSALIQAEGSIFECVDVNDIMLDSLINPSGSQPDAAGSQVNIKVRLDNKNPVDNYEDILKITVRIHNSKNEETATYSEILPLIRNASDTTYTFSKAYTVPKDTSYSILVFISNKDDHQPLDRYSFNDTLKVIRKTDYVIGINETSALQISMSQNTPNPAKGKTRIDYSIPTDGEVTFHIYSISGQLLFAKTVETLFGRHHLELNSSALAPGIYFYSMEFKGQRLVKRMSVAN
jgi:hypothetical protein